MPILFDLDGTLSDPAEGILGSIYYALERLDVPIPTQTDLLLCIGPPLRQSFSRILQTESGEVIDHAISLYREHFVDRGIFDNRLYDGIPESLGTLFDSGERLYLATSKPHLYASRILEHFGLQKYFWGVYGSELNGDRSAKGELISWLLQREGIIPEECIMIGDRSHDVIGAMANSILPIGVLWGYGSRSELADAGCQHFCERVEELPFILNQLR